MLETRQQPHSEEEILGHPIGLFILFFTEMWERFSYYGMRAILVLFVTAPITGDAQGGMGWDNAEAIWLYGWYTMLVYVMGIPGGFLADRVLGAKKAVMLGGLLLCAGHGILAVEQDWAFYSGLLLIILGVGALKPNISTMVGGLYKPGDVRRDKGFSIFYIGINVGAFLAGITVAQVAATYGWHAGFGLAGIGMVLGQVVYVWGQKYLKNVGNLEPKKTVNGLEEPLTAIEWDRIKVMLISFLLIIAFWGAFEQAGGLLNIYAQDKINRVIEFINWEVPAGYFQSANSFYIMLFAIPVAGFWARRALKGKESSTILKMSVGTIIMGLGFVMMAFASMEAGPNGKAAITWLMLAYLLHTIGELCASPTALSFVTKLAPAKYGSLMMGAYFAATGFGNKLAAEIGESSQSEPIEVVAVVEQLSKSALLDSLSQTPADGDEKEKQYVIEIALDQEEGKPFSIVNKTDNVDFGSQVTMNSESASMMQEAFAEYKTAEVEQLDGKIKFTKDKDAEKPTYTGTLIINQVQNDLEFRTFIGITIFTGIFGLLVIMLLKPLKRLTHGAEDLKIEAGH